MRIDVLKGHLGLVLLASLRDGPRHGYAISKELRERSGGEFDVLEGTLHPALPRLQHAGLIMSRWGAALGRRLPLLAFSRRMADRRVGHDGRLPWSPFHSQKLE